MRFLVIIIVAIFTLGYSLIAQEQIQRYAIVIGVSKYKNLKNLPNLQFADKDASEFKKIH